MRSDRGVVSSSFFGSSSKLGRRARLALSAAVLASAPFLFSGKAHAATQSFDASGAGPTAPVDGSGNWDTTTSDWATGGASDVVWTNGNLAQFGNSATAGTAGTVTIDTTGITASGLQFNATAAGSYTIAGASGADTLTMNGTGTTNNLINLGSSVSATISAVIASTGTITVNGPGTLTLTGANTYNNNGNQGTNINGGATLVTSGAGQLGTNSGTDASLNIGNDLTSGDNLTVNNNLSLYGITVNSTANAADTITIGAGDTLFLNGGSPTGSGFFNIGNSGATNSIHATLTVTGGTLNATGGMLVGQGTNTSTTLDNMTGLASFSLTGTSSTLGVGLNGGHNTGILQLSNTANTITEGTIDVGVSNGNNGSASTMVLGNGTNVLNTANLTLGMGKGNGVVSFTGTAGTVIIDGTNGNGGGSTSASTTAIIIGDENSGTTSSTLSILKLAGHSASVGAGLVILAEQSGGSTNGTSGQITFDTGTFNATTLEMSFASSGTSFTTNGSFTMGNTNEVANAAAIGTGVLNLTGATGFILADNVDSSGATNQSTFVQNGGTVNVSGSTGITIVANHGTTTAGYQLLGGLLNMNGVGINLTGQSGGNVTSTFVMPASGKSATIQALGGSGIVTSTSNTATTGGILVNGGGTLYLVGSNTYSTDSTILSGNTLAIGGGPTAITTGTIATGLIDDRGTLDFNQSNSLTYANQITNTTSGTGNLTQSGAGNTTLSNANNNYIGATNVTGGTLTIAGTVSSNSSVTVGGGTLLVNGVMASGTGVAVNSGTLSGSGTINGTGAITVGGGTVAPGSAGTTLNAVGLTLNSGNLAFDVNAATASELNLSGTANLVGGGITFTLSGGPTAGSTFTILNSSAPVSTGSFSFLVSTVGRTTLTPEVNTGNSDQLVVVVGGGPANLIWTGVNGTSWDTQITQNWNNVTAPLNPDYFYQADNVSFDDTASPNLTVNIGTANVAPSSVTFNNDGAASYTFTGGFGIAGATGVSLTNTGTVTFNNPNSYTGTTSISGGGELILGSTIASPSFSVTSGTLQTAVSGAFTGKPTIALGNGSSTTGTIDLDGTTNTVGGLLGITGFAVVTNTNATTGTLVYAGGPTADTFGGSVSDNGADKIAVTVSSGTLQLNGGTTYSGATSVTGGALVISGPAANIGSPTISVSSGGIFTGASDTNISASPAVTDNGTINLNNAATISTLAGSGAMSLSGVTLTISGGGTFAGSINDGTSSGSLAATGGTLNLTGTNSNYTGTTTINGADVRISGANSLGSDLGSGAITISNGGTLDLTPIGTSNLTPLIGNSRLVTIAGTGVGGLGAIYDGSATIQQEDGFESITLSADASIGGNNVSTNINSNDGRYDIGRNVVSNLTLNGFTLTKSGSNFVNLATNLAIQPGNIVVNGGTLSFDTNVAWTDTTTSNLVMDAGTNLQYFQNPVNVKAPVIVNGANVTVGQADSGNTGTASSNFALNNTLTFVQSNGATSSGLILTGNITDVSSSLAATLNANADINAASGGIVAGTGSILVAPNANSSVLILAGTNTYTGTTTINSPGLLQIGNGGATGTLGSGGNVIDNGNLFFKRTDNALNTSNAISGTGGVANIGTGTVTLSGTNSYTGVTTAYAGVLNAATIGASSSNSAIGAASPAAANLVFNGGTLQYTGTGTSTDHLFTIDAGGATLDSSGSGTLVFSGTGTIVSEDPAIRTAVTTNGSTLVKFVGGAGQGSDLDLVSGMTVTGSAAIAGGTTIASVNPTVDELTLSQNATTGTTTTTLTFGTLARTLTLTGSNGGQNILDGLLSNSAAGGTLSIAKNGTGEWLLGNNSNNYTGSVAINNGVLAVNGLGALGSGTSAIAVGSAATAGELDYLGGTAGLSRAITVGTAGGNIQNDGGGTLTLGGTIAKNGATLTLTNGTDIVSGQITGALANSDLHVINANVTLSNAANNYNGNTLIDDSGDIISGALNALPTGTTLTLGGTDNGNATFDLHGNNQTLSAGGLVSSGTGALTVTSSSGAANLNLSGGTGTFGGNITGGITLNIQGNGSETLTSAANTYSGATTIDGTLISGATNAIPVGTVLTLGNAVSNDAGTLDLHGNNQTLSGGNISVAGTGTANITSSVGTANLNVSGGTTTYGGEITGGVALNIQNTGTMKLTGTANSYTGGTSVDGTSTLTAAASGALPTGGAIANNGNLNIINNTFNSVGRITGTGTLTIGTGTDTPTLQLASNAKLSTQNALAINSGAQLDLNTSGIGINYGAGPQATADTAIESYLSNNSYAGIQQSGTGITSSALAGNTNYALGVVDGNDMTAQGFGASTGGGSLVAANTVEVGYTLLGDLLLNGQVNGTDFGILVGNFGASLTGIGWEYGDVNGDGVINGTDFGDLVSNFGQTDTGAIFQPSTGGTGGGLVTVPEPATLGMFVLGGMGLLARRRRRNPA